MSDDGTPRDDASDGGASPAGSGSALSTVGALMEERRRYESWLEALDARRAETPKHVFARVHADYTARLDAVVSRLTSHAGGLRAEVTALTTRIATLDEQQHRARDERAESQLRAQVGELSEEAWKSVAAKSDGALAELAKQHAQAVQELQRTRELLEDAERPATPVQPAPPVPQAPAAGASAQTAAAESAPFAPKAPHKPAPATPASDSADSGANVAGGAPATASSNGSFDELAFLSSVVDTPGGPKEKETGKAPASAPRPPAPEAPSPPKRESYVPRGQDAGIQNTEDAASPKIEPRARGRGALAANISGNNPIVLKDKSAEAAKTLKCAECGAQNYPTEWYCERCGAELASL